MHTSIMVVVTGILCGCTINAEGPHFGVPPASVQGSNDVQGAPLSVPGAGMGAGSTGTPGAGQANGESQ